MVIPKISPKLFDDESPLGAILPPRTLTDEDPIGIPPKEFPLASWLIRLLKLFIAVGSEALD